MHTHPLMDAYAAEAREAPETGRLTDCRANPAPDHRALYRKEIRAKPGPRRPACRPAATLRTNHCRLQPLARGAVVAYRALVKANRGHALHLGALARPEPVR